MPSTKEILKALEPKKEGVKTASGYKPKDEIFNKKKTYKDESGQHQVPVDYKRFSVDANEFILWKGSEVDKAHVELLKTANGGKIPDFLVKVGKKD